MLIIKLLSISYLFWVGIANAQLQNEDFATTSQMETRGLTETQAKQAMLHDSKIYVTANGINKLLVEAIEDGDIGGYLSPTTTEGDLIIRGASEDERLQIGSNGHVLTSNGTTASWQALPPVEIDINAQDEKTDPVGNDIVLIEDSADSFEKKKVKLSNLPLPLPNLTIQVTDYTSGSGTYNVPAGTYALFIESIGGGGGGGREAVVAGGGGQGGYSYSVINSPNTNYTYSVGGGGAGRTGSSGPGSTGGQSNCAGVVAGGGGGGDGLDGGNGGSGTVTGHPGGNGNSYVQSLAGQFTPQVNRRTSGHGGGGGRSVTNTGTSGSTGISASTGSGGGGSGGVNNGNGGNGGSGRCKFTAYIAN